MKKLLLVLMLALVGIFAQTSVASAYLHVDNARSYAKWHVWDSVYCDVSWKGGCRDFPNAPQYDRISDTRVDVLVEIKTYSPRNVCERYYIVKGNDGSEYIGGARTTYWVCWSG